MGMNPQLTNKQGNNIMKLTNKDIEILQDLLQDKLDEIDRGPEGIEVYDKPEVYINIIKKLDTMYFE